MGLQHWRDVHSQCMILDKQAYVATLKILCHITHLASLHDRVGREPPGKSGKLGGNFCLVLSA